MLKAWECGNVTGSQKAHLEIQGYLDYQGLTTFLQQTVIPIKHILHLNLESATMT